MRSKLPVDEAGSRAAWGRTESLEAAVGRNLGRDPLEQLGPLGDVLGRVDELWVKVHGQGSGVERGVSSRGPCGVGRGAWRARQQGGHAPRPTWTSSSSSLCAFGAAGLPVDEAEQRRQLLSGRCRGPNEGVARAQGEGRMEGGGAPMERTRRPLSWVLVETMFASVEEKRGRQRRGSG
jgi:hypothetical protein